MKWTDLIVVCFSSVMTPYYSEETVYSKSDLELENEDGVSIIFYLQKIFPGIYYDFEISFDSNINFLCLNGLRLK